ncbi:hypothetical protein H0264_02920 [Nocardia huaxiensis]|uniref:YcxB-like protein domain-containing protein n=1 Tax=Nocardia huaxiensis TaxID=2755382 RepID=A0A7D6V9W3_9NOCA|nr:hypothetical protein [Nocardia huaxiensis]QLY31332.1 hypothetical protein H0264_02920 [Nocardia huaxiensis]
MGGVNDPEQYPGWGNTWNPAQQPYEPMPKGYVPAAYMAAEQGFPALPPIPAIEHPTAVYVAGPDTAQRMIAVTVREGRRNRGVWLTLAVVTVAPTALLALGVGFWALLFPAFVTAPFAAGLLFPGMAERGARAGLGNLLAPGAVLATRFGGDTMEIHQSDRRLSIAFRSVHEIIVHDDAVLVRGAGLSTALPRELFPDWAVQLIRGGSRRGHTEQRAGQPPAALPDLPEIPPLTQPGAVVTADAGTAERLNAANSRRVTRDFALVIAFPTVPVLLLLALGQHWALLIAFAVLLAIGAGELLRRRSATDRKRLEELLRYAAPGRRIAVRFGPEAFDLQSATFHLRFTYTDIRAIHTYDGAVLVHGPRDVVAVPRELFTESAIDYLRSRIPKPDRKK